VGTFTQNGVGNYFTITYLLKLTSYHGTALYTLELHLVALAKLDITFRTHPYKS